MLGALDWWELAPDLKGSLGFVEGCVGKTAPMSLHQTTEPGQNQREAEPRYRSEEATSEIQPAKEAKEEAGEEAEEAEEEQAGGLSAHIFYVFPQLQEDMGQ